MLRRTCALRQLYSSRYTLIECSLGSNPAKFDESVCSRSGRRDFGALGPPSRQSPPVGVSFLFLCFHRCLPRKREGIENLLPPKPWKTFPRRIFLQKVSSLSSFLPVFLFGCLYCSIYLWVSVAGRVLEIEGHARSNSPSSPITSEGNTVTRIMAGTFEFNCILRFCCGTDEALDGNHKKT